MDSLILGSSVTTTPHNPNAGMKPHQVGVKPPTAKNQPNIVTIVPLNSLNQCDGKPMLDPSRTKLPDKSKVGKAQEQLSPVREMFNTKNAILQILSQELEINSWERSGVYL